MEAALLCAGCPVRVDCLRESFQTWQVSIRNETPSTIVNSGCWGGATEQERDAIRHLDPDERIDELERTFPGRLAERVRAFEAIHPARGKHRHCRGKRWARARKLLDRLRADSNV
jgi:hypothetical protein